MRRFSRWMPRTETLPPTYSGYVVAGAFGLGFLLLFMWVAEFRYVVMCLLAFGLARHVSENRRLRNLARTRSNESLCTFVRAFRRAERDPYILRATWDALEPHRRYSGGTFPLRPTDRFKTELRVLPEDLDYLGEEVAKRAGRSLRETQRNPYYDRVHTVGDFVAFLVHQPRTP